MVTDLHATLTKTLSAHLPLSKRRVETMVLLLVGMLSARTVNLSHIASERGASVKIASTYRRLQRFFQHVSLGEDWAVRLIVALLGIQPSWVLCLDRTNWRIGSHDVNILMLALVTRRHRIPLLWTLIDHRGNSTTAQRIALMNRYLALFEVSSIRMLLADREFIGAEWFRYLNENNIPFTIRLKANMVVVTDEGQRVKLSDLLRTVRGPRTFNVGLPGGKGVALLPIGIAAKRIKEGELLIVATNKDLHRALARYRERWSIETLFGEAKTRGLNLEDTRIKNPKKLGLLLGIVALAMAWASITASKIIGNGKQPKKAHGYAAKSWFRTGFDALRNAFRSTPETILAPWLSIRRSKGLG